MFRPTIVLPLALAMMAVVVAIAFGLDCLRLADRAARQIVMADEQLAPVEAKLVAQLSADERQPEPLTLALRRYDPAAPRNDRLAAFEQIASQFEETWAQPARQNASPEQQQDAQRQRDDAAGLLNRWRLARPAFDEQTRAYDEFLASFRGRVAQRLGHAP